MPPSLTSWFRRMAGHGPIVLPGLYAWLTTAAIPAAKTSAGLLPRLTTALALAALLMGPALLPKYERFARGVGIFGFVGLTLLSWLLLGDALSVERLEPVRAGLGAVGWALFAFGWGRLRNQRHVPENDPQVIPGPALLPRATLPKGASAVFGGSLVLATLPVALAWRVDRPAHALLAHAAALLAAIGLVVAGARVATERGRPPLRPVPEQRLRLASTNLLMLAVLCLVGLSWVLLS